MQVPSITNVAGTCMSVLTLSEFATVAHLRSGHGYTFDGKTLFPALNAINAMSNPIFSIGQGAASVFEAFAALKHIEKYLWGDERCSRGHDLGFDREVQSSRPSAATADQHELIDKLSSVPSLCEASIA